MLTRWNEAHKAILLSRRANLAEMLRWYADIWADTQPFRNREVMDAARTLTETIEARNQAKADAITKAPMPVDGLGFGEGVVTFDGLPFDQAETSAQIRVGVAIAMQMNPTLRVIRIKEGSFLDADNVAMIAEMARANDYQVWIETVRSDGRTAIVIEDGMVVAVDGEPVPASETPA